MRHFGVDKGMWILYIVYLSGQTVSPAPIERVEMSSRQECLTVLANTVASEHRYAAVCAPKAAPESAK